MKISYRAFLLLMDGREHHGTELIPFLAAAVPPQVANNAYVNMRRHARGKGGADAGDDFDPETVPAERRVKVGARRAAMSALIAMRGTGYVEITRNKEGGVRATHDERNDDFFVRLTDKGRAHLFESKGDGRKRIALGNVVQEMRRLLLRGAITVSVRLNDVAPSNGEDQ